MQLEPTGVEPKGVGHLFATAVWGVLLLGISVRAAAWPRVHSVYPIFTGAAHNWLAGADLYFVEKRVGDLDHYRYSPFVAVLLIPFSVCPDWLGGVLWRLLNAGVYLAALGWWARAVLGQGAFFCRTDFQSVREAGRGRIGNPSYVTREQGAVLFLLAMPLAVASLNNGQSNALVIGLLLAAVAGAATQRWNLASVCLALACLFKVYPLAVALLLVLTHPRELAGRLLLALVLGLGLPFLLQRLDYVSEQYATWFRLLGADDRSAAPLTLAYRDLWLLCRLGQVPLERSGYLVVQLLAAGGIAGLCLAGRLQGWPQRRLLTALTVLGTCWMTLLGPATESCTYTLLAPALAWAMLEAWLQDQPRWPRLVLGLSYGLFLASHLRGWFPDSRGLLAFGLQPLGALLLFACAVAGCARALLVGPAFQPDLVRSGWKA